MQPIALDRGDSLSIDGRRLTFVEAGNSGPDILLLHGFGSDRLSWSLNQPELAARARTRALDLPSHGGSDADVGDGTIATLSQLIATFADARRKKPVHLIGHSLGGAIAVTIADQRPDLVASLFLIAPLGFGKAIDAGFFNAFLGMETEAEAREILQRLVMRPRLISPQIAARVLDHLNEPGVRANMAKVALELSHAAETMAPAIARVAQTPLPRIVVWGADDTINIIDQDGLSAFGGRHFVIERTRHIPQMESPAHVNMLLRQFIDEIHADPA